MVCVTANTGFLFDLVPDPLNANITSYPVYQTRSMLNTNPNFDFSEFAGLADLSKEGKLPKTFGFTFTTPGTYVFANSANANAQTVIMVLQAGSACPTDGPVVPLTESTLLLYNAATRVEVRET